MKSLKDIVRKVIAHKHLGKEMIGAITINEVRDFFRNPLIEGYVKFNKVFIRTQDQGIKIEIFKKKQAILAQVNEKLAQVGYATKMVEIMLK